MKLKYCVCGHTLEEHQEHYDAKYEIELEEPIDIYCTVGGCDCMEFEPSNRNI